MTVLALGDGDAKTLALLLAALDDNPGATEFERSGNSVRQLGDPEDKTLRVDAESLRRLGHRRIIKFDRSKAPRHVFSVAPNATEFIA